MCVIGNGSFPVSERHLVFFLIGGPDIYVEVIDPYHNYELSSGLEATFKKQKPNRTCTKIVVLKGRY